MGKCNRRVKKNSLEFMSCGGIKNQSQKIAVCGRKWGSENHTLFKIPFRHFLSFGAGGKIFDCLFDLFAYLIIEFFIFVH